ncbi:queuosine precursor transporter [Candidatus Dojkabacteria bacterium]|nr:queuosine precursor transporter [Candidatus Dojkabacteria bacterium]
MKIQKLDLLISIYIAAICLAEITGGKIFQITDKIQLFGNPIGTSVAVFLIPFISSINDVVVEVYGKKRMLSIARSGLIAIAFIFVFLAFSTFLPTAERSFVSEVEYNKVFLVAQRVSIASLIAFAFSIGFDILIFSKIREKLKNYGLWFRNITSNVFSQFIDTLIFYYLAYYDLTDPNHDLLWARIIAYWIYKCVVSFLIIPLVYLGVRWLSSDKTQKIEN